MNYELFKQRLEDCIEASSRCSRACLGEENHFLARCAKLNNSSVIVSKLAIKTILCRSELLSQVFRLCIEIFTTCAEECEKFTQLDHCIRSAAACRNSIRECRLYLESMPDVYHTTKANTFYDLP